jgi:rod shape determining protein RodA
MSGGADHRKVTVQIIAFAVGIIIMVVAMIVDPTFLERIHWILYGLSILIQMTVFVLPTVGGGTERAWVNLGFTTMQPSEFVKITFVLAFAGFLQKYRSDLFSIKGFIIAFAYAIPIIGLVAYIDMGAGIVMGFIFVGMVFAAGIKMGLFLRLAGAFLIAIPIVYRFLDDYQKQRFEAFLHQDNASIEATYQLMQSKVAIGSGGLFCKGLGHGTIKESGFLPVQESDFIFSVICEELGFVGGAVVIVLFGILIARIWKTISKTQDVFGALICVGFLCMFGFQLFENIGMTMGLMPITGITLPFLSSGGTSVIANMLAVGLVAGVSLRGRVRSYKNISTTPAGAATPDAGWITLG